FIALALLLGRKIDSSAYPGQVPGLLDEFSRTSSPVLAAKLRLWLEKALQLSPRSFATADEAVAAISDLPDEADVQAATLVNGLDAFPQEAVRAPAPVAARPAVMDAPPERRGPVADRREPAKGKKTGVLVMALLAVVVVGGGAAYFMLPSLRSANQPPQATPTTTPVADLKAPDQPPSIVPLPVNAGTTPATTPVATPTPLASPLVHTAATAAAGTTTTAPVAASVAPAQTPAATPAPGAPVAPAATTTGTRFGGLTVKSGMELQVFENGSLIGSTAGPIAIGEGSRAVEVVNETLGFRYRQTVVIKAGQMTNVNIAVPNGKVSINAAPWAEVDIDGKPAGETPLANLTLPIGTHEITFRHPQLGTKKQTIVVKVEGLTKVTELFKSEAR